MAKNRRIRLKNCQILLEMWILFKKMGLNRILIVANNTEVGSVYSEFHSTTTSPDRTK